LRSTRPRAATSAKSARKRLAAITGKSPAKRSLTGPRSRSASRPGSPPRRWTEATYTATPPSAQPLALPGTAVQSGRLDWAAALRLRHRYQGQRPEAGGLLHRFKRHHAVSAADRRR
jgi:hypothetical protein